MINVSKIRIGDTVAINYTSDIGEFRIKSTEDPSPDLTSAIAHLKEIFVDRLQMKALKERVGVDGLDTGNDDTGDWYRISGYYTANMFKYKILSGKMHVPTDPEYFESRDPEKYPSMLTEKEEGLLLKAVEESESFITGKRAQQSLPFDGDGNQPEQEDDTNPTLSDWLREENPA